MIVALCINDGLRALRAAHREGGGRHDQQRLGLVSTEPGVGGAGPTLTTDKPCSYCGIVGGHSGNCPVIS